MPNEFYNLMENIKNRIELELSRRPPAEKIALRVFMPLTVNLISDRGNASLTISKDCSLSFSTEPSQAPDVTVYITFETLKSLYYHPDKEKYLIAEREGRIKIVSHTFIGTLAEKKLRELLGG